ncbi:MAG TPA: GNAT family N-acetyltransferase [Jatrophihabitans sp.]|nr:GNAT family N-acetyltransferase [Jatrophihabitans sp.]
MTIEIRPATQEDSERLALVHVRSWQAGYRGLLPDAFLDSMSVTGRADRWRARLAEGGSTVTVALLDGALVGFATVGPSRDADLPAADWLELQSCYLLPGAWGSGVATELARRALPADRRLFLWVLAGNLRAQGFYRKLGFAPDGTGKPIAIGAVTVPEVRWRCDRPKVRDR